MKSVLCPQAWVGSSLSICSKKGRAVRQLCLHHLELVIDRCATCVGDGQDWGIAYSFATNESNMNLDPVRWISSVQVEFCQNSNIKSMASRIFNLKYVGRSERLKRANLRVADPSHMGRENHLVDISWYVQVSRHIGTGHVHWHFRFLRRGLEIFEPGSTSRFSTAPLGEQGVAFNGGCRGHCHEIRIVLHNSAQIYCTVFLWFRVAQKSVDSWSMSYFLKGTTAENGHYTRHSRATLGYTLW